LLASDWEHRVIKEAEEDKRRNVEVFQRSRQEARADGIAKHKRD